MTDYNDGKWHGWNGGECPVHAESDVQVIYNNDNGITFENNNIGVNITRAGNAGWFGNHIIAFRVIKAHKVPREWWIFPPPSPAWSPVVLSEKPNPARCYIHVREVIEEEEQK